MFLDQLSPATIRAYATCLEHRREFGEPPTADEAMAISAREGGNPTAVIVLTRWELFAGDGRLIPLNGVPTHCPTVIVPDAETAWAILSVGRTPTVCMTSRHGNELQRTQLSHWAQRER